MRKDFEYHSRFVRQLEKGTKLAVVDWRRTADGAQRMCVVIVGEAVPVGWITYQKAGSGKRTLTQLVEHPLPQATTMATPMARRRGRHEHAGDEEEKRRADDTLPTPSPFLRAAIGTLHTSRSDSTLLEKAAGLF